VIRLTERRIAAAVGGATALLLGLTSSNGFVRDEGYYFKAAAEYHTWFQGLWRNLWRGELGESFRDETLRAAFGYNTEHPGLVKIAMGFSHAIFTDALGLAGHATGYRLASIGFVALGAAFTYLMARERWSRGVGLLAVALLFCCPHVFYHSHLAAFDGPVMGMTVVVVYLFWRSVAARRFGVGLGMAWGAAVATKHNAVFLAPLLLLAWALAHASDWRREPGALRAPPLPAGFVSMALLAPVVFYLCYPYGWHDAVARIGAYYRYHLSHEHYPVEYFGTLYTEPPFPILYPFVMSALTIPVPILLLGLFGFGRTLLSAWRRSRAGDAAAALPDWLVVLAILVPPAIIAVPSVPIFGGTKHWMTMMPFFAMVAAATLVEAAREARRFGPPIVAAVLLLGFVETARSHPYGHTWFNEVAGGHQGGAALRLPRTFWGGDGRGVLEALNASAAQGANVFGHRMNWDDFRAYQRDGLLRNDLRYVTEVRRADWAVIVQQREYEDDEYAVWNRIGDTRPVAVVAFDGVPIVSLYRLTKP
jgi:4-amino-4-deoxy-L-arabinose transferase-like glycosyltransferase